MPKLVDHARRREEILRKISPLVRRHSIDELGLRQLAQLAGMSLGAFSHYFRSKEKLYDALVGFASGATIAKLRSHLEKNKRGRPVLEPVFEFLLENEDECLTELLLVLDFARKRGARARESRAHGRRAEAIYLDFFQELLHLEREASRFFLTYMVGFLARRMWTGRAGEDVGAQIRHIKAGLKSLRSP